MNQVKCPGCGLSNPAKNRECLRCSASLPRFADFQPQPTELNFTFTPGILIAIAIGTAVIIVLAVGAVPVFNK
jgi:hypothetical protein